MKRVVVAVVTAIALAGCGGDDIDFKLNDPPPWLKKLDAKLPAKSLWPNELTGNCVGVQFRGDCRDDVRASKSLTRKARFTLQTGVKAKITYTPNENANPVTITLRDQATVPVRKGGGRLTFVCISVDPCQIAMQ